MEEGKYAKTKVTLEARENDEYCLSYIEPDWLHLVYQLKLEPDRDSDLWSAVVRLKDLGKQCNEILDTLINQSFNIEYKRKVIRHISKIIQQNCDTPQERLPRLFELLKGHFN